MRQLHSFFRNLLPSFCVAIPSKGYSMFRSTPDDSLRTPCKWVSKDFTANKYFVVVFSVFSGNAPCKKFVSEMQQKFCHNWLYLWCFILTCVTFLGYFLQVYHSQTKHYFVKTSPFENQTMAQCMCRVNQYTAPYIIMYTVCVLWKWRLKTIDYLWHNSFVLE